MRLLLIILGVILAKNSKQESEKHDIGVTEIASTLIKYNPAEKNDYVGAKGATVIDGGLRLRQSTDKGGIVLFLNDNEYDEWSFEYTISNINLRFPEQGGVYMWCTKYDQDMGEYRGGDSRFNGLMAGIEFKGMSPEIVYGLNYGENVDEYGDYTVLRDSFEPSRLKGVKDLTVKVILTHNNFKVELYDNGRLLYDSFRYVYDHPFKRHGVDKRFSITSYYLNTSSEKSFILKKAQLYKRTESDEYDAEKVHAKHVEFLPVEEHEVHHPDKDVREFMAQFSHFMHYIKGVLGDIEKPSMSIHTDKIIAKIEETNNTSFRQNITNKINDIDRRLQLVHKTLNDLNHNLREFESHQNQKTNRLAYVVLGVGLSFFLLLSFREYKRYSIKSKNL